LGASHVVLCGLRRPTSPEGAIENPTFRELDPESSADYPRDAMKTEAKARNSETPMLMVWITIGTILLSLTGVKACGAPRMQRQALTPKVCTEG